MPHANEAARRADVIAALQDRRRRAAALAEQLAAEIDRYPSARLRGKLDRLGGLIDELDRLIAQSGGPSG